MEGQGQAEPVQATAGETEQATPPSDIGNMEQATPPNDIGKMEQATPPSDIGKMEQATPPSDSGKMEQATPPSDSGKMEQATPSSDSGKMEQATPPSDSGKMEQATPPSDSGKMEQATPPSDSGKMEQATPPSDSGKMEQATPPSDSGKMEQAILPSDIGKLEQATPPSDIGKMEQATPPSDIGKMQWRSVQGIWVCRLCQKRAKSKNACKKHDRKDCQNVGSQNPSWQMGWDRMTMSCRYCGQTGFARRRNIRKHLQNKLCPRLPNWNVMFGRGHAERTNPPGPWASRKKGQGKLTPEQQLEVDDRRYRKLLKALIPRGSNDDDDDDDDDDDSSEEDDEGQMCGYPPWGFPGAQQGFGGPPQPWNQPGLLGPAPGSAWQRGPGPNIPHFPPAQLRPPLAGGPRPLMAEWGGPPQMARGPRPLMAAWPEQRPMGHGPRARGPRPVMGEWPGQLYWRMQNSMF